MVLYTDADTAFTSRAFLPTMEELGVDARIKTGRNDIATVDAAIRIVKTIVVNKRSESGEADWAKHVPIAVKAFNSRKLGYLMERAPKEVKADGQLEFMLQRQNYQFLQRNLRLLARRTNRLTDKGFVRAYIVHPRTTGWLRVGENR